MICPTCNDHDIGEPPWPSWYQCANCDIHPETSLHRKTQREKIAALEAERDELKAKLKECLIAKSLLYPPGATYLNNPDNMNDPRMLDGEGNVITP